MGDIREKLSRHTIKLVIIHSTAINQIRINYDHFSPQSLAA